MESSPARKGIIEEALGNSVADSLRGAELGASIVSSSSDLRADGPRLCKDKIWKVHLLGRGSSKRRSGTQSPTAFEVQSLAPLSSAALPISARMAHGYARIRYGKFTC